MEKGCQLSLLKLFKGEDGSDETISLFHCR